jgi:hypothetical protein
MRLKRLGGLLLMPIGLVLILASFCETWLAIADYFDILELWGATCPGRFHSKALLIGGVVIAVIGQRLYSGRDLKTGKKPEPEN